MRNKTSLTKNQKECLRLVAQGMTSKEIAVRVGLSPSTVDTYLREATSWMGAENRRVAARRFLAGEHTDEKDHDESEGLRYQSADVAEGANSGEEAPVSTAEGSSAPVRIEASGLLRPPPIGGPENELGAAERLIQTMRIALFLAAVMTGLVLFAWGAIKVLS